MFKSTLASLLLFVGSLPAGAAEDVTADKARKALELAGAYFRDELGVSGTYVWQYSPDGAVRRGEGGKVEEGVGWIQPPGTPAVGAAFLRIYEVTGETAWLEAAQEVAAALIRTQLLSGGWYYHVDTDPLKVELWCYRASGIGPEACREIKANRQRNTTMLDDNTTQSVLNFLMWFDEANNGQNEEVRDCIDLALRSLMAVQYPNGAFPVYFSKGAPGADVQVPAKASVPESWPREWVKPAVVPYFIVNDNLPRDMGRLFLNAYRLYEEPEYLETATRLGDFLLAAQLPQPQQGWAQQYNNQFQPAWGRKFEPPALASNETAGSIDFLLELSAVAGKPQYLEAAKSAADWLAASEMPDGSWSRFYELGTNRPLYVNEDNQVTLESSDLLEGYVLKEERSSIEPTLARVRLAEEGKLPPHSRLWISAADELSLPQLQEAARKLVEDQDPQGRWTVDGLIDGNHFVEGVFELARIVSLEAPANQ